MGGKDPNAGQLSLLQEAAVPKAVGLLLAPGTMLCWPALSCRDSPYATLLLTCPAAALLCPALPCTDCFVLHCFLIDPYCTDHH
jgi:hypothetical protein